MENREENIKDISMEETPENAMERDETAEDKDFEKRSMEAAEAAAKIASLLEEEEASEKSKEEAKIAELNDKLLRNMAEFDNFRKRNEKEKAAMFDMGMRSVVEKILPMIDNFERGLSIKPEDEKAKAYFDGMDMIYKQFVKILEDISVKPIDCIGKEFDPNFHNAVMHIEDENYGENVIVEELQKGYMYKDTVLRYSMVKVAN